MIKYLIHDTLIIIHLSVIVQMPNAYQTSLSNSTSTSTYSSHSDTVLIPHEQQVYEYIMQDYESSVRPLQNRSDKLKIQMRIRLQQIVELNEKTQVLTTLLFLEQIWQDIHLRWNETKFGGVRTLRIPANQVWTPDTYVFGNADYSSSGFLDGIYVLVRSSGQIVWPIPVRMRTSCLVDISEFPFDKQTCELRFGSWIYQSEWVEYEYLLKSNKLSNSTTDKENIQKLDHSQNDENIPIYTVDTSSYWDSTDWMLMMTSSSYAYRYHDFPFYTKSSNMSTITTNGQLLTETKQKDLILKLFLKRRSFFYIWNIVVPCLLLNLLSMVIFWTPVNSGEKVTLGLSVFLAFSMFMMLIAERVPPTARSIPLIGFYMISIMTLTAASVVISVIVINLDSRGDTLCHPPKWILKIMAFQLVRKLLGIRNIRQQAIKSAIMDSLTIDRGSPEFRLQKSTQQIHILQEIISQLTSNYRLLKTIRNMYRIYHIQSRKPHHSSTNLTHLTVGFKKNSSLQQTIPDKKDSELKTYPSHSHQTINGKTLPRKSTPQIENPIPLYKTTINQHHNDLTKLDDPMVDSEIFPYNYFDCQLQENQNLVKFEWKLVARLIDRGLFVIFAFVTIASYLIIFLRPMLQDE